MSNELSSITVTTLGFEIGCSIPERRLGSVSRDDVAIFFRRKASLRAFCSLVFAAESIAHTMNCGCWARKSLSLSKRSPGVCVNSQWKTSMATAFISRD